jgi:hypothetical protein
LPNNACGRNVWLQVTAELERLDGVVAQRTQQLSIAQLYPSLHSEHQRQEGARQQFELRKQAERTIADASRVLTDHHRLLRELVYSVAKPGSTPDWTWTTADDHEPVIAIDRLLVVARSADPESLAQVERDLQVCSDVQARLTAERHRLAQYGVRQTELERQIADHLAPGDPHQEREALDRRREGLVETRTRTGAEITAAQAERDRTIRLIANIQDQMFGDACPTCGRPFSESDAAIVLDSLRHKESSLRARISSLDADQASVEVSMRECSIKRELIGQRIATIDDIRQRLDRSVGFIAEQQKTVADAEKDLAGRLTHLGRTSVPTDQERDQAANATKHARSLANCEQTLVNYRTVVAATITRLESATTVASELADATFDPVAFETLTAELARADRARTSIQHMDQELTRRPALEGESQILERGPGRSCPLSGGH